MLLEILILKVPFERFFPGGSDGKQSACNLGDLVSVPGSGRSPGGGHGNPLQDSCLENPKDRGAWWATVRGVAKSWTLLKRLSTHTCTQRNKNPSSVKMGSRLVFPQQLWIIVASFCISITSFFCFSTIRATVRLHPLSASCSSCL